MESPYTANPTTICFAGETLPYNVDELRCNGASGDVETEKALATIMVELFEAWKAKHKSYGKGNISQFGEKGVLIRASDKISRLVRLLWDEILDPIKDEKVQDTWKDLATYALIALLVRRGAWPTHE